MLSDSRFARLLTLILATVGGVACVLLLVLLAPVSLEVQAAPAPRRYMALITGTTVVTHTTNTTHEMNVFADGRVTSRFFAYTGDVVKRNQVDQDGDNPDATTFAVMFDQHDSTPNAVDVGAQGEFVPLTPITLNTSSNIPGYSEDTYVVYASKVLSYQIAQRTLATTTNNCVVIELQITNTGSVSLTGGKFLFMLDIDAAYYENSDAGHFDPSRSMVYHTDENPSSTLDGYAVGFSILEGELRGYAVRGSWYPTDDSDFQNEMITPTNAVFDGSNDVSWLVADLPVLTPGDGTFLSFGLCAKCGTDEAEAGSNLMDEFSKLVGTGIVKTSLPAAGSASVFYKPITYQVAISATGSHYIANAVITDVVPAPAQVVTLSVTQGDITMTGRLITATLGRLYPASGTVTMTVVITFPPTVTDGLVISNRAFVHSEPIITHSNQVTHQVINSPVLTVTKFATPAVVVAGEELTYTIVVSNGDRGYAFGVVLSDELPAEVSFVTATMPHGGPASGVITWPLGTLGIGAGRSVTLVVRVDSGVRGGELLTNVAGVSCTARVSDSTVLTTPVRSVADLEVVKGATPSEVVAGAGVITYTLYYTNHGPSYAYDLTITDTLPLSTSYGGIVSSTLPDPTVAGREVVWRSGVLTAGAGGQVVFTATVEADAVGPLSNGVVITAAVDDPAAGNNADSASTGVSYLADLTVSKSDTPDPVLAGTSLTYTVVVTDLGPSDATGVQIFDALPSDVVFNAARSSSLCVESSPGMVTCQLGRVPAGAGKPVTIVVTVPSSMTHGSVLNNLVVASGERTDPNNGNNGDSESTTVVRGTDLTISKDDSDDPVVAGTSLTYTLVVTNRGPSDATNVRAHDILPGGVTFDADSSDSNCAPAGAAILCTLGDLGAGRSATATIVVTVPSSVGQGTLLSNWAIVSGDENDPQSSNNTASENTGVIRAADLSLSKADAPDPVLVGNALTYTLVVVNGGPSDASGVWISDTLPLSVTFNAAASDSRCVESTSGTLSCNIGTLTDGSRVTVTVVVTVAASAPHSAVLTNTATAHASESDPNGGNDRATTTTTVHRDADLEIAVTAQGVVVAGTSVTYTLVVTNNGPLGAVGVVVSETLPDHTSFVPGASASGWQQVGTSDVYTLSLGYLAPDATATVTFGVAVASCVPAGVEAITNVVAVAADPDAVYDPEPANNRATLVTPLDAAPDLVSAKWTAVLTAAPGITLSYTIVISNVGSQGGTGVVISDTLPGYTSFITASDGGVEDNGVVRWPSVDLGCGEVLTRSLSVAVDRFPFASALTNTVTVADDGSNGADGNASDNTFVLSTPLVLSPAIGVTKSGPATAALGETVVYTIVVANVSFLPTSVQIAALGDGSPIGSLVVTDSLAGPATYVGGDDGDGLLEVGERWIYTVTHVIAADDPDPLINVAWASGRDGNGRLVVGSDSHTLDIEYAPAFHVEQQGPAMAHVGDNIVLTCTVSNDVVQGDGSSITDVHVDNDPAGEAAFVGGDDGDGVLEGGEVWVYTAQYHVQSSTPNPLRSLCTAHGTDRDGDPLSGDAALSIEIEGSGGTRVFLPLVLRSY